MLVCVLLLLDYHGIYIGSYRLLGGHLLLSETEGESENVYGSTEAENEYASGASTESGSSLSLLTEAESEGSGAAQISGLGGVSVMVEDTTEATLPAAPVAIEVQVEDATESETEPDGRNLELIAQSIGFAQSGNVSTGLARGHVSEETAVGAARSNQTGS